MRLTRVEDRAGVRRLVRNPYMEGESAIGDNPECGAFTTARQGSVVIADLVVAEHSYLLLINLDPAASYNCSIAARIFLRRPVSNVRRP